VCRLIGHNAAASAADNDNNNEKQQMPVAAARLPVISTSDSSTYLRCVFVIFSRCKLHCMP